VDFSPFPLGGELRQPAAAQMVSDNDTWCDPSIRQKAILGTKKLRTINTFPRQTRGGPSISEYIIA
jgi:hypothetical protein